MCRVFVIFFFGSFFIFPSFVCLQHVELKGEEPKSGRVAEDEVKLGSSRLKTQMRHDHDSNFLRQSRWWEMHSNELDTERNIEHDIVIPLAGKRYIATAWVFDCS